MANNHGLWKLSDEDIYLILYLSKIEGIPSHLLENEFSLSPVSLQEILNGKVRKTCYERFTAVEKHLQKTSD